MKDDKKPKRYSKWIGFLGFLGFRGLWYFKTHDVSELYYFMYFAWFGHFLLSKINVSITDEMYLENEKNARAFIGILAMFLISILTVLSVLIKDLNLKPFVVAAFVILVLSYSIKLYSLEKWYGWIYMWGKKIQAT